MQATGLMQAEVASLVGFSSGGMVSKWLNGANPDYANYDVAVKAFLDKREPEAGNARGDGGLQRSVGSSSDGGAERQSGQEAPSGNDATPHQCADCGVFCGNAGGLANHSKLVHGRGKSTGGWRDRKRHRLPV